MKIDANAASGGRWMGLGALAGLVALAGVGVLIAQPSTAGSPATLDVLEPAVQIHAEGAKDFAPAESGATIEEGAIIRTDRTGLAAVSFEDGSLTRLGPATTYELTTLRTEDDRRQIVGRLDSGQTFHRVSKVTGSGSRFEVETSNAVAAVRGTAFAVQCVVLDVCEIGVTEGTVSVQTPDGRQVDVTAGHRVTVSGDGELGELKLLVESDPWIARNLELEGESAPPALEKDPAAQPTTTDSGGGGDEDSGTFAWGGRPSAGSTSEPASSDGSDATADDGGGDPTVRSSSSSDSGDDPQAAPEETTTTTSRATTSSTEATTTTTAAEPTTTTTTSREPDESSTTTTTATGQTTTTTGAGETTTTTAAGATTTTTAAGETTTTTSAGGSTTTTTSGGVPTTVPGSSTTTTAPCAEGEERIDGECKPECPHGRDRETGNCRADCSDNNGRGGCAASASTNPRSSQSKEGSPLLWILSFLFGGTVLTGRAQRLKDD